MLIAGSSLRPTPSQTSMLFCSNSNCGWVSIWNCSVTSKSWASNRASEIFSSGRPRIGSAIARAAWAKAPTFCVDGTKPARK